MSINVRCGKCSMSYTAAEKLAGQQVVCPRCGNSVTVPTPGAKSSDDPLADALGAANSTQAGQTKKSSRRSKSRGKSGSKLQLSGRTGVLLGLLAVLVVAAVVYFTVLRPGQSGKRPGRPPAVAEAGPTQPGPPGPETPPPPSQPDGTPTAPGQETPPGPAQPETTPTSPQPVNPPTGDPYPNQGPPPTGPGQPTGPNYGPSPGPGYPQYPNTPTTGPTQRPQDLAQWKKEDYFSARAEGDARLVEAVGYLAQRFVGNAPAARMLGQLLEPPKPQEDPAKGSQPGYGPQYRQASPQLVQAVVAALAINGTDVALALLEQLLTGTLATEDDKTAVDAALNALAAHPSAKAQDLLFRALTAPGQVRAGSGGNVTADQLRETALAAVSATASEPFRTRLATYLAQPGTSPQLREQIGGLLSQQHPDNVGAQLILYQSAQTAPETKATLEQYFIAYSSAALGEVLGIPAVEATQPGQQPMGNPPQQPLQHAGHVGSGGPAPAPQRPSQYDGPVAPGGFPAPAFRPNPPNAGPMWRPPVAPGVNQPQVTPADPEAPYRRARQLWSPQTASTVEGRLSQLKSLEGQAQLLMLAGTFPVDSTRSAASKILHDHWADGPAQLESAGLSTSVITDPGLLLTIKTLPRRAEADAGATPGTTPDASYRAPNVSPRGNPRQPGDSTQPENRYRPRPRPKPGVSGTATEAVETAQQVVEKRMQAERDWMKTSEGLVRVWCARLNAAGLARAGAAGGTSGGEPDANLPVKLHPQANVVSEYHLNWPGDLGSKLSGIAPGPMEVHYLRIADKSDPVKRLGFYRRQLQLRAPDVHPIQNGYWMDRVVRLPKTEEQGPIDKTGWKRSVDILITMVQGNPELARGEDTELVIEILSIEMKDPAKG